ncbi:PREDICTED: general odorant-binding protein 28a-like [Rhagoletis zephyria]|uniref:general odorant-binding protein 28a-like n=1 Tax=Rhagoletis zephyria TaxID=28612 RepID=UPI0008113C3F|nr:PREDICTED: general odorant-binding protein 28a-like [Rhagoletis zephyria]
MAKLVLIGAFCILNAAVSKAAFNKEEAIKNFMTNVEECRGEVGAAASDIEDLIKKAPAASKEGKCLRSCMMKKYGVMDDGGKFVKSVALEHASTFTDGDAEKMKTANEITDACAGIAVPDDHCEAAEIYGKCFMEQAKAHGLDKFEF